MDAALESGERRGLSRPDLAPDARERLEEAAWRSTLQPWQREFMVQLAHEDALAGQTKGKADSSSHRLPQPEDAWVMLDLGLAPKQLHDYAAIYDPLRNRMVVFGGFSFIYRSQRESAVWELSLSGSPVWNEITPSGTLPSVRGDATAIYDPVRDRLVVFGGSGPLGGLNDVWALSLAGTPAWTQLAPTGTPPSGRHSHSAIYDPVQDRMVIFGGMDGSYRNDVWGLSLSGDPAWSELAPSGTLPSVRGDATAIYDAVRGRMLIFGGADGSTSKRNDVWALSLMTSLAWNEITPSGTPPSARYDYGAIYDPVRDRMLIFGGWDGSCRNDVWELSLSGNPAWNEITPSGTPPIARFGHWAIYDPVRDHMVVFGGYTWSPRNDVWELSLSGSPAWIDVTPPSTQPNGRNGHVAIYDPVRDRMVVFGGGLGAASSTSSRDVWVLSLSGKNPPWAQLEPSGTPPFGRSWHSAAYDPVRDRVLVFGGYRNGGPYMNDLWELSLGSLAWTQLAPSGTPPSPRGDAAVIFDPVRDRIIVFGGYSSTPLPLHALSDAWELPLSGDLAWSELTPTGTLPSARGDATAIYDPARDRMVVFGGDNYDGSDHYLNDVWTLSLTGTPAWTELSPSGTPPGPRWGDTAIYDAVRDRMIVFGGCDDVSLWNDTWELSLSGTPAWTELEPSGSPPSPRHDHTAVYDAIRNRMVIFGGYTGSFGNDVWMLALDDPTPVLVSLVDASVSNGAARITWHVVDLPEATVERCARSDLWEPVGRLLADGSGRMVYEDGDVEPGHRYGYRLAFSDGGTRNCAGEAWVDVPLNPSVAFALRGAVPNPAVAGLRVAFTLPDERPARLELYDVGGRLVLQRNIAPGPGNHIMDLSSQDLAEGVYHLRLTYDGRTLTSRTCVLK